MDATGSPDIDALLVHEPFLRRLARAVLRTEEGVEDVVQETWRASLTSGPRDPERAKPWLAAVTRNFARKLLRSRKRRAAREEASRPPGPSPSPSEIAEREETRRKVLDGLLGLDEPYRTTLLLRFYEDLPPREVARRMDAPVETVRTRTRRGLEQLKQAIEDRHHGDRRAWILGLVVLAGGPPKSAAAAAGTVVAKAGLALIPAGIVAAVALGVFSKPAAVEPDPAPPHTVTEPAPPVEPPPEEAQPAAPPEEEAPEPPPVRRTIAVPFADAWKGNGDAPGMVEVPGGAFTMGVDEKHLQKLFRKHPMLGRQNRGLVWPLLLWETPEHEAETETCLIDVYEVTNAQYLEYVEDARRRGVTVHIPEHWPSARPTEEQLSRPVRFVSATDAAAFAAWAGKHVPTEEEWEKAARGGKGYLYPWGNRWNAHRDPNRILWKNTQSPPAPPQRDGPIDVDTMREGRSRYGCFHMLGNVMEWTSSLPRKYPKSRSEWPHYGDPRFRVVRGGCWVMGQEYNGLELMFRATSRILEGPEGGIHAVNRYQVLGFRCARYPTAMRDVLTHRLEEVRPLLPEGLQLDPAHGFGVESPAYRGRKNDPEGKVFVTGRSRGAGFIPVRELPFQDDSDAREAGSGEDSVFLGLLLDTWFGYRVDRPAPGSSSKTYRGPELALLGIREERLAVFDLHVEGPRFAGYLRKQGGGTVSLDYGLAESFRRLARVEADARAARFDVVIPRRGTRRMAFRLRFRLDSEGPGSDRAPWIETPPR